MELTDAGKLFRVKARSAYKRTIDVWLAHDVDDIG
jgi:hypothetical protein